MKRIVLAVALGISLTFANPLANANNLNFNAGNVNGVVGKIGSIFDYIDGVYTQIDEVSKGTLSQCFPKPSKPSFDICSRLPQIEINLPKVCGTQKTLDMGSYLSDYCKQDPKSSKKNPSNGTITGIDNGSREVGSSNGGGTYRGGQTPSQHYSSGGNGDVKAIVADKSPANTAFMQDNQENLKELDDFSKESGKKISDVTVDDIVATIPKTQDDYYKQRDILVLGQIGDIISYSPYNLSIMLENELKGLKGVGAKNKAYQILQNAINSIDDGKKARQSFALKEQRQKGDLVYTNQEVVNLYRDDKKIEIVAKIREQMQRETNTLIELELKDEARKNLLHLTTQKALIMNETFDRAKARAEIEQLIR